jgi:hypothetical protein
MYLAGSIWSPKRRVADIHVGELSEGSLCEQHTTRTTIVLAFWQAYDNTILIMFGTN